MNIATEEAKQKLWDACQQFIRETEVRCDESIYQTDDIIIAAPELVGIVGEIVGFLGYED